MSNIITSIITQAILDQQFVCKHSDYKIINLRPGADGIEDVKFFNAVCTTCNKILADRSECISATCTDVYDKEWGDTNHIYDCQQ